MRRLLREIEIGDWYAATGGLEPFEVVAVDDDHGTIEIQYYDGTLEEVDFETWGQLDVEESSPPEDSSGALDAEREDLLGEMELANGPDDLWDEIDQLLS